MAPTMTCPEVNLNEKHLNRENDADMIAGLQRGEAAAMADLYNRYGRAAYAQILRLVRDYSIAEDLVQETFIRVWNHVQFFDGSKGCIGPWVLAIARNRAIDYLRSTRRSSSTVEFDETDSQSHPQLMEREALTFDSTHEIHAALEKLGPHHLRVIELAYFEGLSHLEVAERMGQPLGTVKSWVRMALKHLRDELMPRQALPPALACATVRYARAAR
jgi:RNA polymerase sigma-70 factor, ECF subfamily